MRGLGKVVGAGSIVAGAILIGFNPDRWDVVFLTLPRGHGIHVRDVVGMVLIALGIALLWHSPRGQPEPGGVEKSSE